MGNVNELKGFTRGQLDAALMKIGQDVGMGTVEGIKSFLRGDLVTTKPGFTWREENDIIYFSVTSDGTTGKEWIKRIKNKSMKNKSFCLKDGVKTVLLSPSFKPTNGITTKIAILKGRGKFFKDDERITNNRVYAEAYARNFIKPSVEVGCLVWSVCQKLSYEYIEKIDLSCVVVMHKPVATDLKYVLGLIGVGRKNYFYSLNMFYPITHSWWNRECGFVFAVSSSAST